MKERLNALGIYIKKRVLIICNSFSIKLGNIKKVEKFVVL